MGRADKVGARKCREAAEVGLEGIEQRERFGRVDVIEVAAKRKRVGADRLRYGVGDLEPAFRVNIRIPAIDAHREYVRDFEVWLRAHRGEVEVPVRVLKAQFVDEGSREHRSQVSDHRLIAEIIVFETGWQVETVVQRRKIRPPLVIEEIAHEERFPFAEGVVDADKKIVVVDRAVHTKIFRGQAKGVYFHVIDGRQIGQHG